MGRIIRDKNTGLIYRYGDWVVEKNSLVFNCAADSSTSLIDCGFSIAETYGNNNAGPIFDTPFVDGYLQDYGLACASSGWIRIYGHNRPELNCISSDNDWSIQFSARSSWHLVEHTSDYFPVMTIEFNNGMYLTLACFDIRDMRGDWWWPSPAQGPAWKLMVGGGPLPNYTYPNPPVFALFNDASSFQIWNHNSFGGGLITIAQKNKRIYLNNLGIDLNAEAFGKIDLSGYTYNSGVFGIGFLKSISLGNACGAPAAKIRGPIKIWDECILNV